MSRPRRYPYTRSRLIFKKLKSDNGKTVFDGRTFEFKTGHMNARKLRGKEGLEDDE